MLTWFVIHNIKDWIEIEIPLQIDEIIQCANKRLTDNVFSCLFFWGVIDVKLVHALECFISSYILITILQSVVHRGSSLNV